MLGGPGASRSRRVAQLRKERGIGSRRGGFTRSHIPLRKWVLAFHLICSSKKGVSALQLQRNLGLGSYKTAWFMAHRIRHAMQSQPLAGMLSGIVEVDTAYIGGKPRNGGPKGKKGQGYEKPKSGRGTKKTEIVVLVERDGEARSMAREKLTRGSHLKQVINENVAKEARVMTDEAADFRGLERHFASHETTNHLQGEYVRGDVHSNTAESFFALCKRNVYGIHHHISRRHINRYLAERAFVWNGRKLTDGERALKALQGAEGKRLVYQDGINASE